MPLLAPLFIGLMLIGALSPLLTFAALFQQKEWRMDRLREHLRRDGAFLQLFGRLRPGLAGLWLIVTGTLMLTGTGAPWTVGLGGIGVFAALTAVQLMLGRQRMPVWTQKAILIVAVAFLLNAAAALLAMRHPLLPPLQLLLQPTFILAAWLMLKPLDAFLKHRVLQRATLHRRSLSNATVIGIAGSVGKTTTKELIGHLLQDLHPIITPARVNTEMGVAQWLTGTRGNLYVVEMGAYRAGEIATLCRIAQPTIGVMTALGSDHLALFGSEEAIVAANGELIDALPPEGHAFLYGENEGCRVLATRASCPVTLTGMGDLAASDIRATEQGMAFRTLDTPFVLPLHGRHNVHNALLAIGVARHLGIGNDRIAGLLRSFRPPAHTFNVRREHGMLLLDDTYNISPLSMRAALDWAAGRPERPRVLLTSGLQETGHAENRYLRELGERARAAVERVVFTDAHGTAAFEEGFGSPVDILGPATARVDPSGVLLAVGRMPLSTVRRLLPSSTA